MLAKNILSAGGFLTTSAARRDGFGHVAFSVHDVEETCHELDSAGVKFQSLGKKNDPILNHFESPQWISLVGMKGVAQLLDEASGHIAGKEETP